MDGWGYPPQIIVVKRPKSRKHRKLSPKRYYSPKFVLPSLKQIKKTYRTGQSAKRFLFPSTSQRVKRMEGKIKEISERRKLKQLQEAHKAMKETALLLNSAKKANKRAE